MAMGVRSRATVLALHLRLWQRLFTLAVAREAQYRAHFVTTVGVGTVQLLLALVPVVLLFGYTDEIRGWSGAEVISVVGLFQLVMGLLGAFVAPNMTRMTELIKRGDLDLLLLRPVSGQFYATVRWVAPAELVNAFAGGAILVAGLARAGARPGVVDVVQAMLLLGCGLVLLSCVWSAMVYLAFWLVQVNPIADLFTDLMRAGQYPVAFYPSAVRGFLTFAFPVAFATSFPAQALGSGSSWRVVGTALVAAVVALVLTRIYWRRAIRGYASASS